MARVNEHWIDVPLFNLRAPSSCFLAVRRALRAVPLCSAWLCNLTSTANAVSRFSLVGLWRCSCGFTYRGHLLRSCPVCREYSVRGRCYRCGVNHKLPERGMMRESRNGMCGCLRSFGVCRWLTTTQVKHLYFPRRR